MKVFSLPLVVFLFAGCLGGSCLRGAELTVFAAASLADALKEIAIDYTRATANSVKTNFGASGTLARQIKEGAPADVFISADELRVDQLEKMGLLLPGTRRDLLSNTLVVIVASEHGAEVATIKDLTRPSVKRVAIGEPATVPVGSYTEKYLRQQRLWASLEEKIVPLDNVRAVLAAVEAGNADAGFVYRTDAMISKNVKRVVEVPPAEGPRIIYPVAVTKASKSPEVARSFVAYLANEHAMAIFARHGFLPAR